MVAAFGTRRRTRSGEELAPANMENWRSLRSSLEQRRCARTLRYRFRRVPAKHLKQLEAILLQAALPSQKKSLAVDLDRQAVVGVCYWEPSKNQFTRRLQRR